MWGMQKIDTEHFTRKWIPETEEEKSKISITEDNSYIQEPDPSTYQEIPCEIFIRSLLTMNNIQDYETSLNFFDIYILFIFE